MIARGMTLLMLLVAAAAPAQAQYQGLKLGDSFDAAKLHAERMGWEIARFPGGSEMFWTVRGSNISLSVCDETVVGIVEDLEGNIEEFVSLVFDKSIALGKPEVQIIRFPLGTDLISTIDAVFQTDGGGLTVKFQSFKGRRSVSTNEWIEGGCG